MRRDLLYLDLALENVVRAAAERGAGAAGSGAGALVGPLLQNLVLSTGDNEELCYCLKAWQALPPAVTAGAFPSREDALKVGSGLCFENFLSSMQEISERRSGVYASHEGIM